MTGGFTAVAEDPRQRLGRAGEAAAEAALARAGCRVLERRFRTRAGEIDLIVLDGDVIVFVEVKARSGLAYGRPHEAVMRRKQLRMARAALGYLARRRMLDRTTRFDVVEVMVGPDGSFTIHHIRDAFRHGAAG